MMSPKCWKMLRFWPKCSGISGSLGFEDVFSRWILLEALGQTEGHKLLQTVWHHQSYRVTVCSFQSSCVCVWRRGPGLWAVAVFKATFVHQDNNDTKSICYEFATVLGQTGDDALSVHNNNELQEISRNHRSAAAYIIRDLHKLPSWVQPNFWNRNSEIPPRIVT